MSALRIPIRLVLHVILMMATLWIMNTYIDQYFSLQAGLRGYITVASLITLVHLLVAPVLHVVLFPLKLLATLPAIIIANAALLLIIVRISERIDPMIALLRIEGGAIGWISIAIALGVAHWVMRLILR